MDWIIPVSATALGFIGTLITLLVNNRKSKWLMELMHQKQDLTNGRVLALEKEKNEIREELAAIKSELPYLRKK